MERSAMKQPETKHLKDLIEKHTRDMHGRVVAITGTTTGTGHICARELARLGATLLLLNRESERSAASLEQLRREVPEGKFEAIACDLQRFASVKAAADAIKAKYPRLDVLCNNAAVMAFPEQATPDGYDVQMQTNSISPFLLTRELMPLLRKSDDGRLQQTCAGGKVTAWPQNREAPDAPARRRTPHTLTRAGVPKPGRLAQGSNLVAEVVQFELELEAHVGRHHASELVPGDTAAVNHDHRHVGFAIGVAVDPGANDARVADLQSMPAVFEVRSCEASAHLGDEPSEQFEQVAFLGPDDLEAIALGLVLVELDRIDRDAGSEQVGAELENMLAAMRVAHGQRFEINVLEVDQSPAAGSFEVEAAAAQ
jgi:NAD(P)-dependent dehydrogenase (short-subunit alcohol dehydrogenase family)